MAVKRRCVGLERAPDGTQATQTLLRRYGCCRAAHRQHRQCRREGDVDAELRSVSLADVAVEMVLASGCKSTSSADAIADMKITPGRAVGQPSERRRGGDVESYKLNVACFAGVVT